MQQDTWRGLSQGSRDNPHLFAQALGKELREIHLKEGAIPQYINVILTCRPSMASDQNMTEVLYFPGACSYSLSEKGTNLKATS